MLFFFYLKKYFLWNLLLFFLFKISSKFCLLKACEHGLIQHLEQLLYYGADRNAQTSDSNDTPLHICARYNQVTVALVKFTYWFSFHSNYIDRYILPYLTYLTLYLTMSYFLCFWSSSWNNPPLYKHTVSIDSVQSTFSGYVKLHLFVSVRYPCKQHL